MATAFSSQIPRSPQRVLGQAGSSRDSRTDEKLPVRPGIPHIIGGFVTKSQVSFGFRDGYWPVC
jgi:hypothetical protein